MDPKILKQRRILRRIIQVLVILAIFLMAVIRINHENDLFWQIRMGENIVKDHFFPTTDPYNSSNPGAVWTLEEWVPSVIFYLIYTYVGPAGLIVLKAAVVALTFFFFLLLFNKKRINLYLSLTFLLLAAMVNTRGLWGVFPSIFEYLFIVITIFVLEYYLSAKKRWVPYFLAFFSFLWVQFHGSFLLFSGIVGAYLLGDILTGYVTKRFKGYRPLGEGLDRKQRKSLAGVLALSFIFPFIHPNGYWMAVYPFRITFGKFTAYVSEYQKFWQVWDWNFSDFVHGFSFILMTVLGVVFVGAVKRLQVRDVFLAGAFVVLALTAVRHVAIFALVALFIIAKYLPVWFGEYRGFFKRTFFKDVLVVILILFFIVFYKTQLAPFSFILSEDGYPKGAAELMNGSGIPGNMFNHYNYGGYLIWKMRNYKVFVDGRLEMYEGQAGRDYQIILGAQPGYQDLITKYRINFFVNYLTDPINEQLYKSPGWKYVYNDSQYVVFVKNSSENQKFLADNWSLAKEQDFQKVYESSLVRFKAEYFVGLGQAAVKRKDYKAALNAFADAVYVDPTYIEARLNLAQMFIAFNSLVPAAEQYKAVLDMDPNNREARRGLSILKVQYSPKVN